MPHSRKTRRTVVRGLGASRGLALGPAYVVVPQEFHVPTHPVAPESVAAEIRRFRGAVRRARLGIQELRDRLDSEGSDPALQILSSHGMILQDRELAKEITSAIKAERMNAAHAVRTVLWAKARYMEALPSELFRSRAADIRDVERRLLAQLLGGGGAGLAQLPAGSVVVASELTPSETAALDPERIAGFVTEHGTLASHVTILARSRGVPAVIGVPQVTESIPAGTRVIVDGGSGEVIVAPTREDIAELERRRARARRLGALIDATPKRPGRTRDGRPLPVEVNIDRPEAAQAAAATGAEGVGLFRTEFFYMGAEGLPDEESQVRAYRRVLEAFGDRPVTVRTLDLGGDKTASLFGIPQEANPFLGLRGIRLSLEQPEVFRVQARALTRAARHGRLQVLLPMVASVEEVRRAKRIFAEAAQGLHSEGDGEPGRVPVGVMIEVPAAVTMSDVLAREADFFSIGSNDLTQYILAVDRGNERIAGLYDSLDPAVLRAIAHCVEQAHRGGVEVGCCGEMASDALGALVLVGLGIDRLSVSAQAVGWIKALLAQVRAEDVQAMAAACVDAADAAGVRRRICEALEGYPQLDLEERAGRLVCTWEPENHEQS